MHNLRFTTSAIAELKLCVAKFYSVSMVVSPTLWSLNFAIAKFLLNHTLLFSNTISAIAKFLHDLLSRVLCRENNLRVVWFKIKCFAVVCFFAHILCCGTNSENPKRLFLDTSSSQRSLNFANISDFLCR